MATETYELDVDGTLAGMYRSNVLHFKGVGVASGDTLAAAESLVTGWNANLKTLWLATVPQTYALDMLRARRATPKPSAVGYLSYGPFAEVGTRGSNASAQQTCPSIFLVPTMGVKSGGRIFWPAVPAGDLDQNAYSAAWRTAVDAAIAAMISGFTTSGITWTLAIYSRKLSSTSDIAGHNYSPVIGFQSKRRKPVGSI